MKKIILHIGSGKTGTSSIQRALVKCVAQKKAHFTFPSIAGSRSNQTFRFAFCDLNETTINVRRKFSHEGGEGEFKDFQKNIRHEFVEQVSNSSVVVVSSEFLFLSSKEEIEKIQKFLKDCGFLEIHIVVYLRNPSSYYLSVAQQALKNQYQMPSPNAFRLDMSQALSNWSSMLPTSMSIREFDKSILVGNNVVSDFEEYLSRVGVRAELDDATVSNESLSAEATQVLQDYHFSARYSLETTQQQQEHVSRARRFIQTNPIGTKPKLKKNISEQVHRRFEVELSELNSRFGIFEDLVVFNKSVCNKQATDVVPLRRFKEIVLSFDDEAYNLVKTQL